MSDEEILRDLIKVAEEEVQEQVTTETIMKPTTEEIRQTIDTLVDFLMFTCSGKIGIIALEVPKLFEKE